MFRQPVQKSSSESSHSVSQLKIQKLWLLHTLSKRQSLTTVLLRTQITQMIFFIQGMLLLGSNHFLMKILEVILRAHKFLKCDWLRPVVFKGEISLLWSINREQHLFFGVFRINTGSWYFKIRQYHSSPRRLVIFWWILKYHSRHLSPIFLEIVLFPILITRFQAQSSDFQMTFSNSLIIHAEKTKEVSTVKEVWICDPYYHKILFL